MKKLLIFISIVCLLLSLSASTSRAHPPSVSYYTLASYYSPIIYQERSSDVPDHCDYITKINYDGNYIGVDNWDHLGYPLKKYDLPAYVYYSVIETDTHYFIWYALFHPADHFHYGSSEHENDLEGIVMCIYKDGTMYGDLRLVQLQAHWHFYQWIPPGETGINNGDDIGYGSDDIDGTIQVETFGGGFHPEVWVEAGGHGLRGERISDASWITYRKGTPAEDPDHHLYGEINYDLLSMAAEIWERRDNPDDILFDDFGFYNRWGFPEFYLGRSFDGDDGSDDAADPPWDWDDIDDGGMWLNGDWFMHPAAYFSLRLKWRESFSLTYLFHPFAFNHLGGDIYNGYHGTTTLFHTNYNLVSDLKILQDQTLNIKSPGTIIYYEPDVNITAQGTLNVASSINKSPINFIHNGHGIAMYNGGEIVMQNGGCIHFVN